MIDKLIRKLEIIQDSTIKEAFNVSFTQKELSIMIIGIKSYKTFSESLDEEIDKKRGRIRKKENE